MGRCFRDRTDFFKNGGIADVTVVLLDKVGVFRESPKKLVPTHNVHAEEAERGMAFGNESHVILNLRIIRGNGCEREFGQGRSKFERFGNLLVDFPCREWSWGPDPAALALDTCVTSGRFAVDVDSVLPLPLSTVSRRVAVIPFRTKNIGAHFLE